MKTTLALHLTVSCLKVLYQFRKLKSDVLHTKLLCDIRLEVITSKLVMNLRP